VAAIIGAFVTALFVLSITIKRNDIADIAWGPGIALATLTAWYLNGLSTDLTTVTVVGLICAWALRIGWRILLKNLTKGEDPRYARWRDSWGKWFYVRSYFQVYLLQGSLMIALAMSAITVTQSVSAETNFILLSIGVLIWLVGFFFETVGDYQLDRFITNSSNRGKIMRYGLWKYSRHPNYFGEVVMWWGIWLIVAPLSFGLIALISPLTITILILYVSGIPLLEASMKKYDEWSEYARKTSIFIPLPPKS